MKTPIKQLVFDGAPKGNLAASFGYSRSWDTRNNLGQLVASSQPVYADKQFGSAAWSMPVEFDATDESPYATSGGWNPRVGHGTAADGDPVMVVNDISQGKHYHVYKGWSSGTPAYVATYTPQDSGGNYDLSSHTTASETGTWYSPNNIVMHWGVMVAETYRTNSGGIQGYTFFYSTDLGATWTKIAGVDIDGDPVAGGETVPTFLADNTRGNHWNNRQPWVLSTDGDDNVLEFALPGADYQSGGQTDQGAQGWIVVGHRDDAESAWEFTCRETINDPSLSHASGNYHVHNSGLFASYLSSDGTLVQAHIIGDGPDDSGIALTVLEGLTAGDVHGTIGAATLTQNDSWHGAQGTGSAVGGQDVGCSPWADDKIFCGPDLKPVGRCLLLPPTSIADAKTGTSTARHEHIHGRVGPPINSETFTIYVRDPINHRGYVFNEENNDTTGAALLRTFYIEDASNPVIQELAIAPGRFPPVWYGSNLVFFNEADRTYGLRMLSPSTAQGRSVLLHLRGGNNETHTGLYSPFGQQTLITRNVDGHFYDPDSLEQIPDPPTLDDTIFRQTWTGNGSSSQTRFETNQSPTDAGANIYGSLNLWVLARENNVDWRFSICTGSTANGRVVRRQDRWMPVNAAGLIEPFNGSQQKARHSSQFFSNGGTVYVAVGSVPRATAGGTSKTGAYQITHPITPEADAANPTAIVSDVELPSAWSVKAACWLPFHSNGSFTDQISDSATVLPVLDDAVLTIRDAADATTYLQIKTTKNSASLTLVESGVQSATASQAIPQAFMAEGSFRILISESGGTTYARIAVGGYQDYEWSIEDALAADLVDICLGDASGEAGPSGMMYEGVELFSTADDRLAMVNQAISTSPSTTLRRVKYGVGLGLGWGL